MHIRISPGPNRVLPNWHLPLRARGMRLLVAGRAPVFEEELCMYACMYVCMYECMYVYLYMRRSYACDQGVCMCYLASL